MRTVISILLMNLLGAAIGGPAFGLAAAPPPEQQIAAAVLAAPEDRRASASVVGWNDEGKTIPLRQGSNELVCLAADPRDQRWSVACYHKDLEPFMARGRELAAESADVSQRREIRFREVEEGKLPIPKEPRTLYVLHGAGFDPSSGEVQDPFLRWVIYVPFATGESTGLPTTPTPGGPWLMDGGTPGAHIMITPPRPAR